MASNEQAVEQIQPMKFIVTIAPPSEQTGLPDRTQTRRTQIISNATSFRCVKSKLLPSLDLTPDWKPSNITFMYGVLPATQHDPFEERVEFHTEEDFKSRAQYLPVSSPLSRYPNHRLCGVWFRPKNNKRRRNPANIGNRAEQRRRIDVNEEQRVLNVNADVNNEEHKDEPRSNANVSLRLPSSKTYSRNRGEKHRQKLRKFKERFISIRSSNLNDLLQPSMSRNGEILTPDLDKKDYENLMEIKRNEKRERIMEREKGKGKEKEEEKVEIDLTNDNEDIEILNEDDDEDVVILNDRKPSFLLRKTRAEARRKWNSMIEDDVWRRQKFGESWNAKDAECYRIQRWIIEYKEKKELERKRKEKELKLKTKASVSMCRDLKVRPLDDDDNGLIDDVFDLDLNHIVATHQKSNIEVRVKDLHTLEEGQWLNDEVMNFYMSLLQDRNLKRIEDDSKCIRVLFMNTFFFTKLSSNSYNYKAVKRWTKKVKLEKKGLRAISNIFELDKLIFPVHVNKIHWCCGCINFKNKTFEYFDSKNGSSTEFFWIIRKYIEDEFNDKLKKDKRKYNLNLNEWRNDSHLNTYPQQQNGFDGGVFTSKCADWISDDLEPDYNQRNMQYFRDRIMVEIIRGKTLDF